MSYADAEAELHDRLTNTVGLHPSPDDGGVQELLEADLREFEGSYLLLMDVGAQPFQTLALTLTEFTTSVEFQLGVEINADGRAAANGRLNAFMVSVWRQVVSDLSWASQLKSMVPTSQPVILTNPTQPQRLVMAWSWQLVYLEA